MPSCVLNVFLVTLGFVYTICLFYLVFVCGDFFYLCYYLVTFIVPTFSSNVLFIHLVLHQLYLSYALLLCESTFQLLTSMLLLVCLVIVIVIVIVVVITAVQKASEEVGFCPYCMTIIRRRGNACDHACTPRTSDDEWRRFSGA